MGNFGENFGANFGAKLGENFGSFVSNFGTLFGNFVQQKGGASNFTNFGVPTQFFSLCAILWL